MSDASSEHPPLPRRRPASRPALSSDDAFAGPTGRDRSGGAAAVQSVREVRVGVPAELLKAARDFYCDVIGLAELSEAEVPGACRLGDAAHALLLEPRAEVEIDLRRRRLVLRVPKLAAVMERLTAREITFELESPLGGAPVLRVADPGGYRVEIEESREL